MKIFKTARGLNNYIQSEKTKGSSIGFVPTMGALHDGHLSLIKESKRSTDITVVSIFVNPSQFNDDSDFDKYPRMVESDSLLLRQVDTDVLFLPTVDEMYQNESLKVTDFNIGYLDTILEGERRPGHYKGVAIIVEKLLKVVSPNKLFMGLKDFQQVKVIEKLILDRNFDIKLIGCPTLREVSGLAMSSRNMRLTDEGRENAICIFKALSYISQNSGKRTPKEILNLAIATYLPKHLIELEYLELRNADDLSEVSLSVWNDNTSYVVLFAGYLEEIRLIDNMVF